MNDDTRNVKIHAAATYFANVIKEMLKIFAFTLLISIVIIGCGTQEFDWEKSFSEQKLEQGKKIKIKGSIIDSFISEYDFDFKNVDGVYLTVKTKKRKIQKQIDLFVPDEYEKGNRNIVLVSLLCDNMTIFPEVQEIDLFFPDEYSYGKGSLIAYSVDLDLICEVHDFLPYQQRDFTSEKITSYPRVRLKVLDLKIDGYERKDIMKNNN